MTGTQILLGLLLFMLVCALFAVARGFVYLRRRRLANCQIPRKNTDGEIVAQEFARSHGSHPQIPELADVDRFVDQKYELFWVAYESESPHDREMGEALMAIGYRNSSYTVFNSCRPHAEQPARNIVQLNRAIETGRLFS